VAPRRCESPLRWCSFREFQITTIFDHRYQTINFAVTIELQSFWVQKGELSFGVFFGNPVITWSPFGMTGHIVGSWASITRINTSWPSWKSFSCATVRSGDYALMRGEPTEAQGTVQPGGTLLQFCASTEFFLLGCAAELKAGSCIALNIIRLCRRMQPKAPIRNHLAWIL